MNTGNELETQKISPSQFMRELRPEYYSDSENREIISLEKPLLAYHLESITQRNETHEFEIFCRKLCERAICPNLRAQTGPDGGGDSKADTETFPVSEEIANLTYVGLANHGKERWAFAFSAKADWKEKVKSDVKGIAQTGRDYSKIFFVTSRPAKAKDRAKLEDALTQEYGIPVTILDQTWILTEIIEKDRKDLALNYLNVGTVNSEKSLGPKDYSRKQSLDEIEKELENPATFTGMQNQRVIEALTAAKLSRNLERSRFETDGRFERAIRLADEYGNFRQQLEARYEKIWTAVWWFDDEKLLLSSYSEFEEMVIESNHVKNLQFLCNLLQLLYNSVIHGNMTREEAKLDQRRDTLVKILKEVAEDSSRPNNSIEAETLLVLNELNELFLNGEKDGIGKIWEKFSALIDRAEGLGEFDFSRFSQFIEYAGNFAGNDVQYNNLVEKLAAFVSKRESEASGARILLRRAQKLEIENHFEIIRLLGRAVVGLTKNEYKDELLDASILLMIAYRSAGLHWAARSICSFVTATLAITRDQQGFMPSRFIPVMKFWAWTAYELRNIPEFVLAFAQAQNSIYTLPISEDLRQKSAEELMDFDIALAALILRMDSAEQEKLQSLPDLLDHVGLAMARSALLYSLGYEKDLRTEGTIPESVTPDDLRKTFEDIGSQAVGKGRTRKILLKDGEDQILSSKILGMEIELSATNDPEVISAMEIVMGAMEAFFATAMELKALPHVAKLSVIVDISDDAKVPSFEIDEVRKKAILKWSRSFNHNSYENQRAFGEFLVEMAAKILAATFFVKSIDEFFEKLFKDESVANRVNLIAVSGNSYHRFIGQNYFRFSDWEHTPLKKYIPNGDLPQLEFYDHEDQATSEEVASASNANSHDNMSIKSVINVIAWDRAKWSGTAYMCEPNKAPYLGIIFQDFKNGCLIFDEWIERFGDDDTQGELMITIVKNVDAKNPLNYQVVISPALPSKEQLKKHEQFVFSTRTNLMQPRDHKNLNMFLERFEQMSCFLLVPFAIDSRGGPLISFKHAITIHKISVEDAEFKENYIQGVKEKELMKGLNGL